MRKLGFAALLALVVFPVGCGGGSSSDPDALVIVDADGIPDAEAPDAEIVRGNVQDFEECVVNDDCMNPNSDCRPIGFLSGMPKECLPKCDATAECPFSTFCYPTGGGSWGTMAALMGDHCWYSLCGEGLMSGATNGTCQGGQEAGAPASDQWPGYCLSISDTFFGQCLEAGTVTVGGVCDFSTQTRGGANCDGTTLCIGQQGMPQGTCAQTCDPAKILTGEATGCTVAGETCFDSSNALTYSDGSTNRQTIGFCTDVVACGLIGMNTCPNDAMGVAQGCAPVNSLRPTGICDPSGTGAVAAFGTCVAGSMVDSEQCTPGSLCTGTCQPVCKRPRATCASDMDCAPAETCTATICQLPYSDGPNVDCNALMAGTTCQGLTWDDGFDMMPGTPDDTITLDWGACQ